MIDFPIEIWYICISHIFRYTNCFGIVTDNPQIESQCNVILKRKIAKCLTNLKY